jgi:extracellular factor (EF) 3-hydroxypalmitic acid methyl ester biosynthesis protein
LRQAFGEALSVETMQGFAFHKPHGYAGDYEIIDRVYRRYITPSPNLSNWDRFFQATDAAHAVRNRKAYFHAVVRAAATGRGGFRVLNVASGPGRDVREYLLAPGGTEVHFDCLDMDADAIAYARQLCAAFPQRVRFFHGSILGFRPENGYDLVWSAGLFDYFDDRLFQRILARLLAAVRPGGQLVIGNFSDNNPTRPYMHLMDWDLYHRGIDDLLVLARRCGLPDHRLRIGQEPKGINLFLHVAA